MDFVNYYPRIQREVECFNSNRLWQENKVFAAPSLLNPPKNGRWYIPEYPRSFQMKPHPIVVSTLCKDTPDHLVRPLEQEVFHHHWDTTTGNYHNEKFLSGPYKHEVIRLAPAATKMPYLFPYCDNRVKMTSERMLYNPMPVGTSVTKRVHRAMRPYADMDPENGPLAQVGHPRKMRFVRRTELRPGFPADETYSTIRKFNPYISTSRLDYRDPRADMMYLPELYEPAIC